MEILKTIRQKFGLSQQDMAILLGLTREHYSMVEIGRRMLPAEPAQIFAGLLPVFLKNIPLPPTPEKIPESQAAEAITLYNMAKLDLYKAEKDFQNCQAEISRQQHIGFLLEEIPKIDGLRLGDRAQNLLKTLSEINQSPSRTNLQGKWALLFTKRQLCEQAVQAYEKLLETTPA